MAARLTNDLPKETNESVVFVSAVAERRAVAMTELAFPTGAELAAELETKETGSCCASPVGYVARTASSVSCDLVARGDGDPVASPSLPSVAVPLIGAIACGCPAKWASEFTFTERMQVRSIRAAFV